MAIRILFFDKAGAGGSSFVEPTSFAHQVPCIERRSGGKDREVDWSGVGEAESVVVAGTGFSSSVSVPDAKLLLVSKIWFGKDITSIP